MAKPVRNYLIRGMTLRVLPHLVDGAVAIISKVKGVEVERRGEYMEIEIGWQYNEDEALQELEAALLQGLGVPVREGQPDDSQAN